MDFKKTLSKIVSEVTDESKKKQKEETRRWIDWGLEANKITTVEFFIDALKDENSSIQGAAASRLGELGDAKAIEPLVEVLKYKDTDDIENSIRPSAAESLGKINDVKAVEPLIEALNDDNPYVRLRSAQALGKIGDLRAIKPLIKALKDKGHKGHIVRRNVAEALGNIRDKRAAKHLKKMLKDEDADTRKAALEALDKIEKPWRSFFR